MKDSSIIVVKASSELNRLRKRGSAARMPPFCRSMILQLPGNATCVDCGAPNPSWACVNYGSLICLQCSGRHRSYGIKTSVVRSVDLDHWTAHEVLKMLEGGNEQLNSFFERHQMGTCTVGKRYHTKAALYYQTHLNKHVESIVKSGNYQGREASRKRYVNKDRSNGQQTVECHQSTLDSTPRQTTVSA